jgi:hypothetical protein
MSVIGEFTVPSEEFLLAETLVEVPEMVVELQRVVAHSEEKLVPFFWVHHGDREAFDSAIQNDSTVEDVVLLDEFDRGTSYRASWKKYARAVAYAYIEAGGTIFEATGQYDTWTLRMRFDDERVMSDFHEYCRREGIPFELDRLYRPSEPMAGGQYGLKPSQRELLVDAYQDMDGLAGNTIESTVTTGTAGRRVSGRVLRRSTGRQHDPARGRGGDDTAEPLEAVPPSVRHPDREHPRRERRGGDLHRGRGLNSCEDNRR